MTVRIKGLDKAVRDLAKKGKEYEDEVKFFLASTATNIELKASQNAANIQTNYAGLVSGNLNINERIKKEVLNNGLTWTVFVQSNDEREQFYGWIEFGQGADYLRRVGSDGRYDAEIQNIARKFLGKVAPGTGRLIGSPYFFPAWFQYTANMVENLKKELAKIK